MSDLISTAPYIFEAFFTEIKAAASALHPPVQVFPFELNEYEPGSYVLVSGIERHAFEPASLGDYAQYETYDVSGLATVFAGASPVDDPSVVSSVVNATYSIYQSCVMTTVVTYGRTSTAFNNTYPVAGAVNMVFPGYARYRGEPGSMNGAATGWAGVIDWSYSFKARITPV